MPIDHPKAITIADFGAGAVTVYDSKGSTTTVNATDMVRPVDWNSAHDIIYNLGGNTLGTSQVSGSDIYWAGGNNITLEGNGSTVSIHGYPGFTAASFQNRQIGLSSAVALGQNNLWLAPARLMFPVSASTIVIPVVFSGTATSNQTNTVGGTMLFGLWKQTATNSTARLDTVWSTGASFTVWNGGTTSVSYVYNGGASGQNVTSNSASSVMLNTQVNGIRMLTFSLGSSFNTGLYCFGYVLSTSSAGNSSVLRSVSPVMDAPFSTAGMAYFGLATNTSNGLVDAGIYGTTTGALPATIAFSQIASQSNNLYPIFKMGAM